MERLGGPVTFSEAAERYLSLQGQVAMVTGAAQGIGLATARTLAELGSSVALVDINRPALEKAVEELSSTHAAVVSVVCDVTDRSAVEGCVNRVSSQLGPVGILIANAGWSPIKPFLEMTADEEDAVISLNYAAAVKCCRAVLPGMLTLPSGRIVLIASDGGVFGAPNVSVYSGAKAGLIGFAKALAPEVSRSGITVNVVSPGTTDTPLLRQVVAPDRLEERLARVSSDHPMGRLGQPQDIANGVAFFCSPAAAFVTGQVLSVNGGRRIPA